MNKHISKVLNLEGIVDTHTHLNSKNFDHDRADVIERFKDTDAKTLFDIATDLESSMLSCDMTSESDFMFSFVGIDPEVYMPNSNMFREELDKKSLEVEFQKLGVLIEKNIFTIKGIGETGMDFYWLENMLDEGRISKAELEKSKKNQKMLFEKHLELAQKFKLPISLHSRGAEEECLAIVKNYDTKGIFHSYTGGYETAKSILDAGWGLGVNGIVTFKNAYEIQNLYRKILGRSKISEWGPEDFYKKGMFFETDAPFLSPEGKRGERNEPAFIVEVYEGFLNALN